MTAHELIEQLGKNLGVELALSAEGTCCASFDHDMVNFEAEGDALWIFADIGEQNPKAYEAMLAANNYGLQTGGATLALDKDRGVFALQLELWADMPYEAFEAKLILFIKALRWWKQWMTTAL